MEAKPVLRWLALLRIIRWYNVLLTLIAQYISAVRVYAPGKPLSYYVLDYRLHLIVLCTTLIISAGFIINSFYDLERDAVNHPSRLKTQKLIGKDFALRMYFWLNGVAIVIAALTGLKVFLFMLAFVAGLWLYSHKLQKMPLVREVSAALLTVTAMVSVGLYYQHYSGMLVLYGFYFMNVLFMRELIKDLVAQKGNVIYGYTTLAVYLGERWSIRLLTGLFFFSIVPATVLFSMNEHLPFQSLLLLTLALNALAVFWEFIDFDRFKYIHANMIMRVVIIIALTNLFFLY